MVKDKSRRDLVCFQRWVITGLYRFVPWNKYERETKTGDSIRGWEQAYYAALYPAQKNIQSVAAEESNNVDEVLVNIR